MYKTKIPGLSSGFRQLDEVTIGWHPSELVIIAARPAMGKTAFGISMAKRMAMDLHIPIAVFSLEMSNTQYVHRYMSVAMGVPLNTKDEKQIMSALHKFDGRLSQIAEAPLYLDDTPSLTIAELRAKAGQLIKEHGVNN